MLEDISTLSKVTDDRRGNSLVWKTCFSYIQGVPVSLWTYWRLVRHGFWIFKRGTNMSHCLTNPKMDCDLLRCILNNEAGNVITYLHFQSKPLMNLLNFATVHSLMNNTKFDWQLPSSLPVQFPSNIKFIPQMLHWCNDWQRATPELHMQNKLLNCSIGCPCSHWLFRFSVLHSNKPVNTIKY